MGSVLFQWEQPFKFKEVRPIIAKPSIKPASVPIRLTPFYSISPEIADNSIAITIDCEGGSSKDITRLLKSLEARQSKATFFICGNWAPYNYKNIKQMVSQGHEIGNHTLTHRFGPKLTDNELKLELIYLESAVRKNTGLSTKPLYRPPYGATTQNGRKLINQLGYNTILWNVDIKDSIRPFPSYYTALNRLKNVKPGSIVLMHSVRKETIDALIAVLPYYQKKKYKLVTITELLNLEIMSKAKKPKSPKAK